MLDRVLNIGGRCAVVAVGAAVCVAAPRAEAQMFGDARMMAGLSISKRSLEGYAKLLSLTEDQKDAVKALHEGYQSETKKATEEFQKVQQAAMREAQEEQDWSAMTKTMVAEGAKLQTRLQTVEKQFLDDVKGLCSEEQSAKWPRVERARRRDQFLRIGMVSGAGVDLLSVADRSHTAPAGSAEWDATAEQYEQEIDRKLTEFKRVQEDMQAKQADQFKDGFDMSKMQELMEKAQEMLKPVVEISKGIRDTNKDYARKLSGLLTEADRAKFVQEFNQRAFPRVYRVSHTSKVLDAALGMADLTPEQKEQVLAAREGYVRDMAGLNEKWVAAIEEQEEKNGGTFGVMSQMWTGGADGADPVRDARKARRELDTQVLDRVKGALNEAQVQKLPTKGDEPFNPMADFMPDMGEE